MHENNFEEQVRKKMDQLGFDPSDAVWNAVDEEINKERKHRRPLFIIFLFSGLLLAGGSIYYGIHKNYSDRKIISPRPNTLHEDQNKSSVAKNQSAKQESSLNERSVQPADKIKVNFLKSKSTSTYNSMGRGDEGNNISKENSNMAKNDKLNAGNVFPVPVKKRPENSGADKFDSSSLKKTSTSLVLKTIPKDSANSTTENKQKNRASLWKFGITGGAGISNTNQSLFKQSSVTGLNYSPSNTTAYGAPSPVPVPSEIKPGFSFNIGMLVTRYFSKRISLSAGLNYHYYSTHIQTGYKVDSSVLVNTPNFGLGNTTIPASQIINGYYQNGSNQSYTNQYHFIELPITADFQLNKSIKLPVYWEAGLSVSYLLSSNALHFDPNGNRYYQNEQLFNRFQLNAITAFTFGFPFNKNELRLGPELQYGLSGLLKSGSGNPQHLLYTGLKISFIRGKK